MGIGHEEKADFKEWEVVFVPVPSPVASVGGRAVGSWSLVCFCKLVRLTSGLSTM